MLPEIPRLASSFEDKAKSEERSYSLEESEGPAIFEGGCTYDLPESDGPAWLDIAALSVSNFSSSSISERPRDIVCIIFSNYIFF